MSNGQHTNPTEKESSVNLRIGEIERKIGSMQNQLTHTVTESALQKTIATLATKGDLRELRDSMRELAERTDKSIRELAERTDKSIRDLRNDMWKVIGLIVAVVVAVVTAIKVF